MAKKKAGPAKDPQAEWWEEDAERLNKMCESIRRSGNGIDVLQGVELPELDEDGNAIDDGSETEDEAK